MHEMMRPIGTHMNSKQAKVFVVTDEREDKGPHYILKCFEMSSWANYLKERDLLTKMQGTVGFPTLLSVR